jgi:hypothetical protein
MTWTQFAPVAVILMLLAVMAVAWVKEEFGIDLIVADLSRGVLVGTVPFLVVRAAIYDPSGNPHQRRAKDRRWARHAPTSGSYAPRPPPSTAATSRPAPFADPPCPLAGPDPLPLPQPVHRPGRLPSQAGGRLASRQVR